MNLKEWKEKIKEKWEEQRKQLVIEGNVGIIYPTTTRCSTRQTPTTVSLSTDGIYENENIADTAVAENHLKIIGLTIASMLAFLIISFIIVWTCRRRVNNENKRKSTGSPLKREDTYHIYAEVEPLTKNDVESPNTNSITVPLPKAAQTRWSGVRYVSDKIFRLFDTNSKPSETNDSIFFSKQSQSVHFPPLPPIPDFPNGDRGGKMRAECQPLSSASCPLMGSEMISTSSDVLVEICKRDNVYNPLTREADLASYDHLKLGKTGSEAHITVDGFSGLPHDYFVLEKENGENPQDMDKDSHPYFILEKEEDGFDKDSSSNPTELEGVDEGDCNIKSTTFHSICPEENCEIEKDSGYFVPESTASSSCLNHGKGPNAPSENINGQTSEKSSSQQQLNTESVLASYEMSKNEFNLNGNQNHLEENSLSAQSSSRLDGTRKGIRQSNSIPNYIWNKSTEHSVNNYDDKVSKSVIFAEDSSSFDHKDCNVFGPNVDTAKQNTSSDCYMEPIKSKTLSEYLEIYPLVPYWTESI
ncbi:hypothetical protein CHS0354_013365 [Potamilus streckersoni]|uniref:Uncharacterized protein n=1 Tax=Potamilus streckersoni TaxID=2493646 RepID=A0AAE0RVX4_9BIVA|nr:hypothetical protein CHS0354_013365 [Potamilus streckersoni]